jgi:hypothetical protein
VGAGRLKGRPSWPLQVGEILVAALSVLGIDPSDSAGLAFAHASAQLCGHAAPMIAEPLSTRTFGPIAVDLPWLAELAACPSVPGPTSFVMHDLVLVLGLSVDEGGGQDGRPC